MRVLIVGASGLIGSAIAGRLAGRGDAVVAVTRRHGGAGAGLSGIAEVTMDVARATDPADWLAYLGGIDAVVNCAGVLQDSPRDSTGGVQAGVTALFRACEQGGVRRVVHVSALGVERHSTGFCLWASAAVHVTLLQLTNFLLRISARPCVCASILVQSMGSHSGPGIGMGAEDDAQNHRKTERSPGRERQTGQREKVIGALRWWRAVSRAQRRPRGSCQAQLDIPLRNRRSSS